MPHNFLETRSNSAPSSAPRRAVRPLTLVVALFGLALFGAASYFAAGAIFAGHEALEGKRALDAAEVALADKDLERVNAELANATVRFDRADRAITPVRMLSGLPLIGPQVAAVDHLLTAARRSVGVIVAVFDVMQGVLDIEGAAAGVGITLPDAGSLATLPAADKRAMLERLAKAAPAIRDIDARVREAIEEIESIQTKGLVPQLADAIVPLKEKLAETRETLLPLLPFVEAIPAMAGHPSEKTYLVLLMNNTELRPGGGFISSYGIVRVKDGELLDFKTEDIYLLDLPADGKYTAPPPKPIAEHLGTKQWTVRDANWSPDFRRSAEQVIALYDIERKVARPDLPPVDGVIGITPDLAVDMVEITGPVTVDGVTFTPENLVEELEYQVEQAFLDKNLPWLQRKDIQVKLVEQVLDRLLHLPADRWVEAMQAFQRALTEKHLLFYDRHADLQKIYEANNWGGRAVKTDGDSLQWVDANLGALKTDLVMDRRLSYTITRDAQNRLVATASMTYRNTGTFTYRTGRYRTYSRVFVPAGSELVKVEGSLRNDKTKNPSRLPYPKPDVGVEDGRTWFGAFTAIEPGETRTMSFTYILPDSVEVLLDKQVYSLVVQKQLGTGAIPLTLNIDLGRAIASGEPVEILTERGDTRYRVQTGLDVDRGFVVRLGF